MHEARYYTDIMPFIDGSLKTHLPEDQIRSITLPLVYSYLADVHFCMPNTHGIPMASFNVILEEKDIYIKFVSYDAPCAELSVKNVSLGGRLEIFDEYDQTDVPYSGTKFWILESWYDTISILAKDLKVTEIGKLYDGLPWPFWDMAT